MMRKAASSLPAFKSLRLVFTMSMTCLRVTLPTLVLFGSLEPAAILAAFFKRTAAGRLFGIKLKGFFFLTGVPTGRKGAGFFLGGALNFFAKAQVFSPPRTDARYTPRG